MDKIKAVAYCRVSTEEQAREGISLDNQQDKVRAYATVKDLDLVEIITDAGISAKDLKREGLQRVLSMLHSGEAEALIVFKLDRLTRSTKDLLTLVYDVLIPQNIALHSISETLDTTNANGRFFLTMLGAMATWELEIIIERTKDAMRHKKSVGEWCGRIPYGFKINGKHLVEDQDQRILVQKAKRMRKKGKSIRAIAKELNVSVGLVHRLVMANCRSQRRRYLKPRISKKLNNSNWLVGLDVQEGTPL